MASMEPMGTSLNSGSQFNCKVFLERHVDRFLEDISAEEIASKLEIKKVIPEELLSEIKSSGKQKAAEILYRHLRDNGSLQMLHTLCDVMVERKGFGKMNELGREMKKHLPTSERTVTIKGNLESQPSSVQSSMSDLDVGISEESSLSENFKSRRIMALDLDKGSDGPQQFSKRLLQSDPPDRLLKHRFHRIVSRVASALNEYIDDLRPTLRDHQKSEKWPYIRLEIEDIDEAETVKKIFDKLQIEDCWLNTSILIHLIDAIPDRKSRKKAFQYLDSYYHNHLRKFATSILLMYIPQQNLQSLKWNIGTNVVQGVTYEKDFEKFSVADLLKEQEFLSRIFHIPLEAFQFLKASSTESTRILWALDISYRKAIHIMEMAKTMFWRLKEHYIIKIEIEGVFQLYLRGNHLPYFIEKALHQRQDLIRYTENFSRQFQALVETTVETNVNMKAQKLIAGAYFPLIKQSESVLQLVSHRTDPVSRPLRDVAGPSPMKSELQGLPETPLKLDSTSSLTMKDDKRKKGGDYHSSLPQEPPQIRMHEELIADTGIRIPSVQSETAPPYYTAIGIESQSSQQLGVDNKALPVLLGMEEDDSERTVTVKRIRGPGSESELPDPQSIQEATQGSSYIRLGPHSPWSKQFYKKYPHREVQSHEVLSPISDTQHDDQDSIVSTAQDSAHEIQLQTVAQEYALSPNIGVPLHLVNEFEPDVVKHSRSKGAAFRSKAATHPSNLCFVCMVCLDGINKEVLSSNYCKDPSHRKVSMTSAYNCPEMLTPIRPRYHLSRRRNFKLVICQHLPNCPLDELCAHPHSQEELEVWNEKRAAGTICTECRWDKILQSGLCQKQCLSDNHSAAHKRVVLVDAVGHDFIHLHRPPPTAKFQYTHSVLECDKGTSWTTCCYPHSEQEARIWRCLDLSRDVVKSNFEFHSATMPHLEASNIIASDRFLSLDRNYLMQVEEHSDLPLDKSRYKKYFNMLLDLEEVIHWEKLRKYNHQYTVTCSLDGTTVTASIEMNETNADIVYQSANEAAIHFKWGEVTGRLCGVNKEEHSPDRKSYLLVDCSVDQAIPKTFTRLHVCVQVTFQLKEWYFRKLRQAMENLPQQIVSKVLPSSQNNFPKYSNIVKSADNLLPTSLELDDDYKRAAFQKIMNLPSSSMAPFLIVGPFGTGKTRLIAAAAWKLLHDAPNKMKILIATHHVQTANQYVDKYFSCIKQSDVIHMVRIVSDSQKDKHRMGRYTKTISDALSTKSLKACNLVITTFIVSQSFSRVAGDIGKFTHIFIDEGAQAREPETVAAFACADQATKIIIAGDHLQVGPGSQVLGDKPQKYGLGISLLTRLHDLYRKMPMAEAVRHYQSVLLSNYRCHSAILRLPGGLFYESSLQSCAKQELHPEMNSPLTFVCTSLEECPECFHESMEKSARDTEITTVFQWVKKCAENWPTVEWGERNLATICVIVPSRLMLRLWKKEVQKWTEEQNQLPQDARSCIRMTDVWCTVSWDIQGREYKAVFICTTEPVDSKHSPEETTKSLCEATVFNTMITRACSLVVACGNPLRILEIESRLADSKHCWMEFLHRCTENKSLLLSERLSEERSQFRHALDLLEKIMLDRASRNLMCLPSLKADAGDSIIQSYNEEFKKKNIRLALGQVHNDSGWKLWENKTGEEVLVPDPIKYHGTVVIDKDSVDCRLWQTSHGDCVAIPYNRHEQTFTVKADKRRCAFEGARVKVEEIGKNKSGERFGRVCQILNQGSIQPVLCEADKNNVIAFYSVDGKSPKFLNLPHVTKQLLDEISEKDLRDHLSKPKKYISCFDPNSLKKGSVPKISDNVPLVAAVNLLFVVQPLYWTPNHRNPIGAVVGAFPKGSSIDYCMKILSIQYQVPDDDASMGVKRLPPPLESDSPHAIGIKGVNGYCQLAFSVETKSDSTNQLHKIGIYVPDITHYICNDRWDFDDHVRHRASYIGECKGTKVYHSVLPKQVLESASFNSSHPVRCFAIRFVVPAEDLGSREYYSQDVCEVYTEKCVLCESIVDYDELEAVLHSTHATQATPLVTTLKDEIHVLFQLAEKLHFNRKGHNAYSNLEPHSYSYPDAWKLVNEFKVLMNRTAAKKMAGSFPKRTLLKVQPPLSEHSEGEIINAFSSFSKFTVQYHQIQFDRHPSAGDKRIYLAHNVCSRLLSVLEDASPDFLLAKQLLSLPMYHVHLLVLDAVISDHVPREEYAVKKIVSKSGKDRKLKSQLDQLTRPKEVPQLAHYTQEAVCSSVTSPFDSVFDIHAQTLLKVAAGDDSDKSVNVSHEKFLEIAQKCNMSTANANNYSIALSSLNLAMYAQNSCVCVDAVIKHLSDGIISLAYHHPGLTMPSVSEIKLSCLTGSSKLNKVPVSLRITSVTGPLRVLTHRSYQKVKKNKTQIHVFSLSSESGNLKQFKYPIKYVPKDASVSLEQWSAALEFTKDPTKESAKKLSSFLKEFMKSEFPNSYQVLPLSRTLEDLSAEKTNKDYLSTETAMEPWDVPEVLFVILKAPFEFTQLQTLKVWLRSDTTEYVATPKPQILELNCDVRVCLQHMQEPEACFTSGVVARSPKVQYSSIKHYCRIWEDLILAEAAVNSIRGTLSQTYLFSDFKLTFSGFQVPQDCFGEEFYEPYGEISSELTKEFLETRQDIFPFQKGDFICARYEIDLKKVEQCIKGSLNYGDCLHPAASDKCARFVIHMIVDEVVKMDDDAIMDDSETDSEPDSEVMMTEDAPSVHCNVKVKFKIENIANNRLSPLMKDLLECNKFTCELQVIPMFLSSRRIYFVLKQMPLLQPKCLAHMIAMGDVDRLLRMRVTNSKDYLEYIQVIPKEKPLCFQRWFGDTSKELNHDQKKAIKCSLMNQFQLIQGPPGTGKSVTGAHIAYAFAMVNRQFHPPSSSTKFEKNKPCCVIYCGPTNVSVDVVFQMLAKVSDNRKDRVDKLRILRIYGRGIERQFYPDPFSNSDVFVKNYSLYKIPIELEDFTLHHLIRRKYSPYGETLKELEEKFKKCHEKEEIPTPADRIRYRETVIKAERDVIMKGNFDVVLCTCNESSGSRIKNYIQPIQCIIDEASMVNEAESMAPISITEEHVVIIGDHKQLQPVVTSETARHNSMTISLFERYASFLHKKLPKSEYPLFMRLGNQYRMLKQICNFPSLMFYGGQLKTLTEIGSPRERALKNFWLHLGDPLVFCDVVGQEETEAEESMIGSKKNRKEAEKAAEIVECMAHFMALQSEPSKLKKLRVTVGILTFYKAQKKLIEETLKERHLEACAAVKTVDASQGSEYDYVILSTVRSKTLDKLKSDRIVHTDKSWRQDNLGFVTDSHRLCVALTRACFGLIIIGNAELLKSNDLWKNLIEHYNKRNYMCTEKDFPTPYVTKRIQLMPKSIHVVPHDYFLKKDENEEMEQTRHDAWALALREFPKAAKKMSQRPFMPQPA